MKEFDLKAALNGEPVMLKNGNKAYIKYNLLDEINSLNVKVGMYPLVGYRLECNYINNTSWNVLGIAKYRATREYDIIGMWEEPKKQISIEDLPKPFTPTQGDTYFYICGFKIFKINKFFENSTFDTGNSKNGQCFRTEEDAQKWLDFMKSMME